MDIATESYEQPQTVMALRQEQGLTQVDLAYLAGLSVGTISRIESGKARPHRATLRALAAALGCRARDLVGATRNTS
jgi:transcriptional regulator with XRE-family HTH domain